MADDVIVEKVFNFICGSGGFAELSSLLKDSSPLKGIETEQEKKNWLKTQARGRFVLVKEHNDDLAGVRIDLRKKICHHYLTRGSCPCAKGNCKFWHVCKGFVEGDCDRNCSRSHDFFDTHNNEKSKELGLDKFPNGTVRNIVAWSLPQVCQFYLRNECKSDKCLYLHLCSNVVRGLTCCCALSHNLIDSHNKKILKQYDLVPHQSLKVAFVRSSILDPKEQRHFGKGKALITTTAAGTTSSAAVNNLSNPITSAVQPLTKTPSIPSQGTSYSQSGTVSQGAASNNSRRSRQNELGSSSKLETKNQKTQQSKNKAKQPQKNPKDQGPDINNLADISTATASSKKNAEFLNIQAEEGETCSDSSSEENKDTIDSFRSVKFIEEENTHAHSDRESGLKNRLTTQCSPSSSSAAKPSCKELRNNSEGSKTDHEPSKKEGLVDSCKRKTDHSATKDQSAYRRSDNDKKTSSFAVPSALPTDDVSKDFVKKWVMDGDEKQSSSVKESDSVVASEEAVKVERQRKLSVSSSCSSVPDPQKCTPSKKAVFDCILNEYDGTVSFADISNRQDLFPNGCGDIGDIPSWFKARKESFLLNEEKDGTILEVSVFCRRAQLCFNQACSRKNCQYLHVCRDFIAGFCRFGDSSCQRNHSFRYDRDRKFLSKLRLNGLTEENLRKVIQLSIPQVCLDYSEGNCARGQNCSQIHICKNMVRKKCEDEEDCGLQHQEALLTAHSTAILQKYGLTIKGGNVNPVLRALLVCDENPAGSKDDIKRTVSTASVEATSSKVNNDGVSILSKDAALSGCEPSERKVFECLCKEYNCSVSFSVIAKRTDLFPNNFEDIESWFRKKKGSFHFTENDQGRILQVNAFSAKARLCFSYNSAYYGTCTKKECSYLHVCRDYVTDSCTDGATCPKNHHFRNEQDKALLSSIKLDQLTDQQLRRLVLSSAPQICMDYDDDVCDRGDECSRIHMCSTHLRKCFKEGRGCSLDHESAMTTDHTRTVLERYHMEHLKSDVAKRIILVYDGSPKSKETGHIHQERPDTHICSDFLLGKCKKGVKCAGHHCSLPYHWQYRVPEVEEWKSFSETDNEELEKLYCDVTKNECSTTGFQISFESEGARLYDKKYGLNFMLDDKLMIIPKDFADVMAEIRRLSSESYASNPSNPVATAWTWYWKDENGMWQEYGVDHLGKDLQQPIEDAFLKKTFYFTFSISEQNYVLYFNPTTEASEMHQENVRYGTTKKVRRRPAEFKSRADIREIKRSHKMSSSKQKVGKNVISGNVPSHWSSIPSDKQYKRVPLTASSSEYKEVETLFKKTITNTVVISSIERVQNPFMWEKYQRKKENMLAVKTGGQKRTFVNEKRLFHGTSPETVEAICKQNFDWRLHGKNATVYGQGSYFALNSSYSDAYAKKDANSSRFMFVAKVLVGSYTEGDSSYRRPPQKDPSNPASDLYDSCVDDRLSPTIFVVFDTDQFYPEYIIKYSRESALHSRTQQAAHGGYQQPAVRRSVPKPRPSQAVASSQPRASQAHTTSTATGYSSGLSTSGSSSYSTASGSSSWTSNSHASSPYSAQRYPSTPITPYSGTSSSNYTSSSSSSYGGQRYPSAPITKYSGSSSSSPSSSTTSTSSARHQSTSSGSYSQHRSSAQSGIHDHHRSSSNKCTVM